MNDDDARRRLCLLLGLTAGAEALFASWPGIDLAVSALFFDPERQVFPLARAPWAETVRRIIWHASTVMVLATLGVAVAAVFGRIRRASSRRWAGWTLALYALGPGLVVNGILKNFWGRARPADTLPFGGEAAFTPAFRIASECTRNCSFVSGEAAAVTALALALDRAMAPRLGPRDRRGLRAALAILVVAGAGLRVATGRHFLSDVVFAILFTALIAATLDLAPWWRRRGEHRA